MSSWTIGLLSAAMFLALNSQAAFGDCPRVPAAEAVKGATVAFSGTISQVQSVPPVTVGQRVVTSGHLLVTFAVDRVWKGPVGKQTVLYQRALAEAFDAVINQRYFVLGYQTTESAHKEAGVANPALLEIGACAWQRLGPPLVDEDPLLEQPRSQEIDELPLSKLPTY